MYTGDGLTNWVTLNFRKISDETISINMYVFTLFINVSTFQYMQRIKVSLMKETKPITSDNAMNNYAVFTRIKTSRCKCLKCKLTCKNLYLFLTLYWISWLFRGVMSTEFIAESNEKYRIIEKKNLCK